MPLGQASILKGAKLFTEAVHGAYYYAFSPKGATNTHSEAYANVVLPTASQMKCQGTGCKRNAYICLGVSAASGAGDGVDLGISYTGNGWHPYYYDVAGDIGARYNNATYTAPDTATNAIIIAKPISATKVGLYVRFVNSRGATVGNIFDQTLTVSSHTWSRFFRFASLVPTGTDNQSDSTYMLGGKFTGLGLYNKTTKVYDTFGIYTNRIQDAWIWSHPKCQVTATSNSDTFTIDHWA